MALLRRLGIMCGIMSAVEGRYKLLRGDNEPLHTNFVYIIEGELEFETEEGDYVVTPGSLLHFPSSVSRRLELRSGRYVEMFFKLFHTADCDLLKADIVTVRESIYAEAIRFAFEQCMGEFHRPAIRSSSMIQAYTEIIAGNLHREVQDNSSEKTDPYGSRLVSLWDRVAEEPNADWTVDRLASFVPISPTHFYRLVQERYGCSPKQYVTILRLDKAQALLRGTHHSIAEVARMVGYANEFSFSNVFVKHVGQRPGAFRQSG
jgi:AraC-like DNA-binding protein